MRRCFTFLLFLALTLAVPARAEDPTAPQDDYKPPAGLGEGWYARIETSMGRILARLLPEQAPQAVAHFAALAEGRLEWADPVTGETRRGRYYDGVPVYRAVAGQRFETGDPSGTGRGAPQLYLPEEGFGPVNFVVAGRLGMTASGGRRISAAQFFVTASAQPFLNGNHPCFGVLIEGREVAFSISQVKTYSNGRPLQPVRIEKVRVFAVGSPPPLADPRPYHARPQKLELRKDKIRN